MQPNPYLLYNYRNLRNVAYQMCTIFYSDIYHWKVQLSWFEFDLKVSSFVSKFLVLNETPDFHFHRNKIIHLTSIYFSHILAHKLIVRSSNKSSHILRQKGILLSTWLTYVKCFLTVTNRTICTDTTSCELLTWEKKNSFH